MSVLVLFCLSFPGKQRWYYVVCRHWSVTQEKSDVLFWHLASEVWFDQRLIPILRFTAAANLVFAFYYTCILCFLFTTHVVLTSGRCAELRVSCFWHLTLYLYAWFDQQPNFIILSRQVCWRGEIEYVDNSAFQQWLRVSQWVTTTCNWNCWVLRLKFWLCQESRLLVNNKLYDFISLRLCCAVYFALGGNQQDFFMSTKTILKQWKRVFCSNN